MPVVSIRDVNDPRIQVYRDLPHSRRARDSGLFIAESKLTVERALASDFEVLSVLCDERFVRQLPDQSIRSLTVLAAAKPTMDSIVGFQFHRGMLACVRRRPPAPLADLGAPTGATTIVVCPQIADPVNLAGIVRNCAAFGADGLILGATCADAFSRRVTRASMGAVFRLPIRQTNDLAAELRQLREAWGWQLLASVLDAGAEPLDRAQRPPKLVLLLGGEGNGLTDAWAALSDRQVTLPMRLGTDSLNVATACGIFLYHFTHVARG